MKHALITALLASATLLGNAQNQQKAETCNQQHYVPTAENLQARNEFSDNRFGIFLHWGLYSMFAQGEWYLNYGPNKDEYAKVADAFYPHSFNAEKWISAIKASGAKYICFTTRHHEGFSMWDTKQSDYNIMNTPYGKDIVRQLADECHKQGIGLHLYYSHIDWTREDYPAGRTGLTTGKDPKKADWNHYYKFMNAQLTELLTNYGKVDGIWFDGWWDHDEDTIPFNWQLPEQYAMIHKLQPACIIGNNHHQTPFEGEDMQMFERDIPGENKNGLSGQSISRLPLETCQTMNGMWGYKITDQNYKSAQTLVRYLAGAAGRGANLLLNIGPQPDGALPAAALERLDSMGRWLRANGETIYGTQAGPVSPRSWGVTTRRGDKIYVHILDWPDEELFVPVRDERIRQAVRFADKRAVAFSQDKAGVTLRLGEKPAGADCIVELTVGK